MNRTGYVPTLMAEKVNDGLNIGTAMAISGAGAAPNMGMAWLRPLSATIAFLNVRLGRWLCHPLDTIRDADKPGLARWRNGKPGPIYLLCEAFFKSGTDVVDPATEAPLSSGFIFLTDGGHIENLGIYELLRRRCAVIIAIDGEADPEMKASSLVRLERFARIDLGTRIVIDLEADRQAIPRRLRRGKERNRVATTGPACRDRADRLSGRQRRAPRDWGPDLHQGVSER